MYFLIYSRYFLEFRFIYLIYLLRLISLDKLQRVSERSSLNHRLILRLKSFFRFSIKILDFLEKKFEKKVIS